MQALVSVRSARYKAIRTGGGPLLRIEQHVASRADAEELVDEPMAGAAMVRAPVNRRLYARCSVDR